MKSKKGYCIVLISNRKKQQENQARNVPIHNDGLYKPIGSDGRSNNNTTIESDNVTLEGCEDIICPITLGKKSTKYF